MHVPLIYRDRPVFGLDIGSRSAKLVQLQPGGQRHRVLGYAHAPIAPDTIIEGILSDPELVAKTIRPLLAQPTAGRITARRVAASLPVAKIFTRTLQLPPMSLADMEQAVHFEAEQYIPVPVTDLYIDYQVIVAGQSHPGGQQHSDVLMVAAPRAIVDSYIKLLEFLELEIGSLEPSTTAITRAMIAAHRPEGTTLVLDIGARTADLAIYDQVVRLTGSIAVGGDDLTEAIVKKLKVSPQEANQMKYRHGVGPSSLQPRIVDALAEPLHTISHEIQKIIKYYHDRGEKTHQVQGMVLSGGSANMPGLLDYLLTQVKLPVTIGDPWRGLELGRLEPVSPADASMYATAIGLALSEGSHD